MGKKWIAILAVLIIFVEIIFSIYMMDRTQVNTDVGEQNEVENVLVSQKVTDEYVEEESEILNTENEEIQAVNSEVDNYEDGYMLRDVDGVIVVYELDEDGNETLFKITDIPTEYLTETDMINMENGLIVYGKDDLNKLLEDFE
jgi:hypothetical protein